MFSYYSQIDKISTQAPDLLIHLCSFFNTSLLVKLWQTNKLFYSLISNRVPIIYKIRNLGEALMLINIFKRIQFYLSSTPHYTTSCSNRFSFSNLEVNSSAMIQDRDLQIIGMYVTRLYIHSLVCLITKKGFECLINLKKLITNYHAITIVDFDMLKKRGVECILSYGDGPYYCKEDD